MDINTNTPIMPGSLNDMTAEVALVSAGYDPTLIAHSVYLCRTNSNCMSITERAIRLNNNITHDPSRSVVTMRKNIKITDDFFVFNFAAVMQSGHQNSSNIQPFFQVRIYDENGDLYNERCILADENDCIFIDATPHLQHNKILYSEWSCVKLNTSELIGQWVDIEFSITDCGLGGHFGYVYIDDLCQENCTSGYGYIDLHPLEEGGTCPEFPIDVCGEFSPPLAGTAQEGTLIDIWLNILENDDIVGTITDVTVTGNEFCFEVQESDFPDPMASQYEFQVVAEFEMNCTLTPYIITLTDTSTNIGPDIKCSLWPRTYGGGNQYLKTVASDIAVDEDGNIYVVGIMNYEEISYEDDNFESEGNGFLAKFDVFGNMAWIEYLPDSTYYINEGDGLNTIAMELVNDRLTILTNNNYLLGYNIDGTQHFSPYKLRNHFELTPVLDVDQATGDIYVAVRYKEDFTNNDFSVLVISGTSKTVIFRFGADGEYNGHSTIESNQVGISVLDIVYSESQEKLYVSGAAQNTTTLTFPDTTQITANQNFGAEYDGSLSVFSDISFIDVFVLSEHIGLLEYDNTEDELYGYNYNKILISQNGFSGTFNAIVEDVPSIMHFFFSQLSGELYFSGNFIIGKTDDEAPIWMDNTHITNYAIAAHTDGYLYVCGNYEFDIMLGEFEIIDYPGFSRNIFIARLKEDGTSVEYRGISEFDHEETLIEKQSFTLYPNPTKDKLNIEPKISEKTIALVTLYDVSGVEILTIKDPINNSTAITFDTYHLKSGIYVLRITDNHGNYEYYRIVKK